MALADKVKKLIRSRAFLLKLASTILVFICVPLLAMQIFVINKSTNEFRRNNQEHYLTLLQASAQTFASRGELLRDTAWRMSRNEEIQNVMRYTLEENPLRDWEAANAIAGYSAEILHMKAAGVFYVSKGYLLANGFKYSLEEYCDRIEPMPQPENEVPATQTRSEQALEMEAFFQNRNSFGYYKSSDGSTLIAALPISLGMVGRYDAVAFFAMDAGSLEESYRANIACQSSIAVLDDAGNYLLKGEAFSKDLEENVLSQFLASQKSIYSEHPDLLLYRYTDPKSDFVFLLAADRDASQEQLLEFAHTVRSSIYVMVAVIIISLLATIYITYRPIHRLLQKYGHSDEQGTASEFERLDSTLFKLDQETETQQDLLSDFILGDLIFGNAVKPELIERYFPATQDSYFVVLTAICPTMTSGEAKQLEKLLEDATVYDVYVTSVPSRPHTVIACVSPEPFDETALQHYCTRFISEISGREYPVCMGEIVQDIHALRKSYRSAVIVNVDPLKAEPGSHAEELAKKLQVLSQCVYMGDEAEALKQLEDIRQFLYANTVGEGHLRYYGFKLLHAYLSSVNGNHAQLSGQEVELLLSFTSMDHLFRLLSESIHQVCGRLAEMENTMDEQMQKQLLAYVDAHFTENEMSLGMAADHVGISIYAVSRSFKEITGQGFKDYVTEKRLEYGHMLLCTTQKSIAEISTAAGFDNANYFSTIFKAKYGLPPTKYRSEYKKKQET